MVPWFSISLVTIGLVTLIVSALIMALVPDKDGQKSIHYIRSTISLVIGLGIFIVGIIIIISGQGTL